MTGTNFGLQRRRRIAAQLLALMVVIAALPLGQAYGATGPRPGAASASKATTYKSRDTVRKMKRHGVRKQARKVRAAEKVGNELVSLVRTQRKAAADAGNTFSIPEGFNKEAHKAMRNQANAKKTLASLKKQTLNDFAAQSNIKILPKAPSYAPPVAPSATLQVPGPSAQQKKRTAKSFLPVTGNVRFASG